MERTSVMRGTLRNRRGPLGQQLRRLSVTVTVSGATARRAARLATSYTAAADGASSNGRQGREPDMRAVGPALALVVLAIPLWLVGMALLGGVGGLYGRAPGSVESVIVLSVALFVAWRIIAARSRR